MGRQDSRKMIPDDFNLVDFPPPRGGFVYIFYWVADGKWTPFYVGEADCFQTRMTDYSRKQFSSSTDFNVGEAAEYLNSKNYHVKVKYRLSDDRYKEEDDLIRDLRSKGFKLMNGQLGYDYHTASKEERSAKILEQRTRVRRFCDDMITA
jgi:hypothetical protein